MRRLRAIQVLAVDVGLSVGARGGESGMVVEGAVTGGADSVTAGELVAASINIVLVEVWYSSDTRGERLWQKAWRSK
jgi:hypothetical protein